MKQFFKFMFASMLGFLLTWIIIFVVFIGIMVSALSFGKDKKVTIQPNSILEITLNSPIQERSGNNPFENFNFSSMKSNQALGLDKILKSIKEAEKDVNIQGIFLNLTDVQCAPATLEAIRNGLISFKKSGKFIVSYSDNYTQRAYYLATAADKIYLNKEGSIELKGLSLQVMFYKGLLEKLDIEPQVIRHGKFKSAVEPYILDKMSEANKEQLMTYLNSTWQHITKGISETRKIDLDVIQKTADNLGLEDPAEALKLKFVDGLMYKDELLSELRKRVKLTENEDISFISIATYSKAAKSSGESVRTKDKIAVIYATGEIVDGEGTDKTIGGESLSKEIRAARLDDNIKAVVLRVNSPGGSALASEIIWREVALTKAKKPVVVSMGDYAASGGYYIACAASAIVAEPTTLTGSIGVFGMVPNIKNLLNKKLGITVDIVKTNAHSDYMNLYRPLDKFEYDAIQKSIERIYGTFIKRVGDGRKMDVASVDSIGQGRIWSGVDGKRLGLVDEIGGLQTAIDIAAKKANITKYRIVYQPVQKEFLQQLFDNSNDVENSILERELGDSYMFVDYIRSLKNMKGVQARVPFVIEIK
jgi:protease-4